MTIDLRIDNTPLLETEKILLKEINRQSLDKKLLPDLKSKLKMIQDAIRQNIKDDKGIVHFIDMDETPTGFLGKKWEEMTKKEVLYAFFWAFRGFQKTHKELSEIRKELIVYIVKRDE